MEPDSAKSVLRTQLKATLRAIAPADRQRMSGLAASMLLATPEYRNSRSVMLFLSLSSEIDTSLVALAAWSAGKTVAVPRADMKNRSMRAVIIHSLTGDKTKAPIGVMEPARGDELDPRDIDLILVPGLAFGPSGERLGRGAGFYDRFLSNPSLHAITCGYAFEQQLTDNIPMSPRDSYLRMLVTDRTIRRFL